MVRLGWVGFWLDWVGFGLGLVWLGWVGFGLGWAGLGWVGLGWLWFGWVGLGLLTTAGVESFWEARLLRIRPFFVFYKASAMEISQIVKMHSVAILAQLCFLICHMRFVPVA